MKNIRLIVAAIFVVALASIPAFAQGGTAAKTPATTPAPANTNVNIPASKIALVNTSFFADEKEGIARYITAARALEREFQPRQTELEGIAKRIDALREEIQKLANSPVVDQKTIQAKQEEGARLEREFKFKQEGAKADFEKRKRELLAPIEQDIGTALVNFAKQRGVTTLLDVANEAAAALFIFADPGMDITKAFIAEYNAKNPGTSASTTPRP